MKKLLLIDGNSMLFRAYHATLYTQMMRTSTGIATNAIYGFMNMFYKAMDLLDAERVVVAFDTGKKTFRHEAFSEYKGTRKEVDEDLIIQFPIVREFLDALGVTRLELEGYEADDLIGSLAKSHPEYETIILTSDRDMLQLIDATTKVLLMKKGISEMVVMDEAALLEQYELSPSQIVDLKSLMGDASDNIPGVKGVGEKTATKLLKDYGTLDNIYAHIDELKGKLKEKMVLDEANARMSYFLAKINVEVPLSLQADEAMLHPQYDTLRAFYNKYEMTSFIKKLETLLAKQPTSEKTSRIQCVNTLPNAAYEQDWIVHVECDKDGVWQSLVIALDEIYVLSKSDVLADARLLAILAIDGKHVHFDAKNNYHAVGEAVRFGRCAYDIFVAAFLLDSNRSSLEKVCSSYDLSFTYSFDTVYGKGKQAPHPEAHVRLTYLEELMDHYQVLYKTTRQEMQEQNLVSLYENVDLPLIDVLYAMEQAGVTTSKATLASIEADTLAKVQSLETQIFALAGHEFNVNSPKQLAVVLFDELGLKANKKRSTAVDVLEKLMLVHPIVVLLMEHRKYSKLYSTYAVGLAKHIQADGKIHTIYNQCLAQTGRLSSIEPNLQNISVRDEEGRMIRKAFVASDNCVLLSADYSQIELRLLAELANETHMIAAFQSGEDIHLQTAMRLYHKTKEEVTSLDRRNAKAVNFGIVYGISDFGLSENLGITVIEARNFIETYFELYPNIQSYMQGVVDGCKALGYVETMLHRRRYINEINSSNYALREFGKRAAMNSPLQGSAADLIKLAMLHVDALMKANNVKSKMILQVHDELIFDVVLEEVELMKALVLEGMEQAMQLQVPLLASVSMGQTWYEAK
ncbi:MAG: DNA polymerase I [Erysipelotrichaceae bacterium]